MKLSISNIGWSKDKDDAVYDIMQSLGFEGLEIAPTRIFPENPYDRLEEARAWAAELKSTRGFDISSLQSIWYGRTENLFGSKEECRALIDYTKKAIDFAKTLNAHNLVFGCPRNRHMPEGADEQIAIDFFTEIGNYAAENGAVIALEAVPAIYNTNYLNQTATAFDMIEKVNSKGFLLNLDVGSLLENGEEVSILENKMHLVHHVHISEPGLKAIEQRQIHRELAALLRDHNYERFVSIEVGKQDDIQTIAEMMKYVRDIFQ